MKIMMVLTSRPRLLPAGSNPKNKHKPIDINNDAITVKTALKAMPTYIEKDNY